MASSSAQSATSFSDGTVDDAFLAILSESSALIFDEAGARSVEVLLELRDRLLQQGRKSTLTAFMNKKADALGGDTLYSFLGLAPYDIDKPGYGPNYAVAKACETPAKRERLAATDVLLLEATMLLPGLFQTLDRVLRAAKSEQHKPFGGCVVVMSGNMSLAPVCGKERDRARFFYQTEAFRDGIKAVIRLEPRNEWEALLGRAARATLNSEDLDALRGREKASMMFDEDEDYGGILPTTFCIINDKAAEGNVKMQSAVAVKAGLQVEFRARFGWLPSDEQPYGGAMNTTTAVSKVMRRFLVFNILCLSVGSQVMLTQQLSPTNKRLVRGRRGVVVGFRKTAAEERRDVESGKMREGELLTRAPLSAFHELRAEDPSSNDCPQQLYPDDVRLPIVRFFDEDSSGPSEELDVVPYACFRLDREYIWQLPLHLAWYLPVYRTVGFVVDRAHLDFNELGRNPGVFNAALACVRDIEHVHLSGFEMDLPKPKPDATASSSSSSSSPQLAVVSGTQQTRVHAAAKMLFAGNLSAAYLAGDQELTMRREQILVTVDELLGSLEGEQRQAADAIVLHGKNILMTGPGGTGKSHVISTIKQIFEAQDKTVAITALTGVAAVNVDGRTLHGLLRITPDILDTDDTEDDIAEAVCSNPFTRADLADIDLLVVDECSMMQPRLYKTADAVFRCAKGKEATPFGGMQILFCGDFCQLPPVVDKKKKKKHADGRLLFELPEFLDAMHDRVDLKKSYRQSGDAAFSAMLLNVRIGKKLDEDVKMLVSMARLPAMAASDGSPLPTPMYLFTQNDHVDQRNWDYMAGLTGRRVHYQPFLSERDKVPSRASSSSSAGAPASASQSLVAAEIRKSKPGSAAHAYDKAVVCVEGARVMLTVNLDVKRGLANGTPGVVIGFRHKFEDEADAFASGELDEADLLPHDRESDFQLNSEQLGKKELYPDVELPIVRFTTPKGDVDVTIPYVCRYTDAKQGAKENYGAPRPYAWYVPLRVAAASTVHKAQGLTVDRVHITIVEPWQFQAGQFYVALSRARSRDAVSITFAPPPSKAADYRGMSMGQIIKECIRVDKRVAAFYECDTLDEYRDLIEDMLTADSFERSQAASSSAVPSPSPSPGAAHRGAQATLTPGRGLSGATLSAPPTPGLLTQASSGSGPPTPHTSQVGFSQAQRTSSGYMPAQVAPATPPPLSGQKRSFAAAMAGSGSGAPPRTPVHPSNSMALARTGISGGMRDQACIGSAVARLPYVGPSSSYGPPSSPLVSNSAAIRPNAGAGAPSSSPFTSTAPR